MTARRHVVAIDGISRVPMRHIAVRTQHGLVLEKRADKPFQSRRQRLVPAVESPASLKPGRVARGPKAWRWKSWQLGVVAIGSVALLVALLFTTVGLVLVTLFALFQLCVKQSSRALFLAAFGLSLCVPLIVLLGGEKLFIARNIAVYLFVLLVAGFVVLVWRWRKNHNERL